MRVADVMRHEVVTAAPTTPIKQVARLLVEHGISGVPVVTAEGKVVGVVSEGDIVVKEKGVARAGRMPANWLFGVDERESLKRGAVTAADAMSMPAVTIEPQRSIAEAARLITGKSVNRLPVVSDGKLVGIVTRADLVRAFARPDEELEDEIRGEVLLGTLWLDPAMIEVAVEDGVVHLTGEVETRTLAELVPAYIALVPGVVSVESSGLRWQRDDLKRRRLVRQP